LIGKPDLASELVELDRERASCLRALGRSTEAEAVLAEIHSPSP
jgi:hypothetical protein